MKQVPLFYFFFTNSTNGLGQNRAYIQQMNNIKSVTETNANLLTTLSIKKKKKVHKRTRHQLHPYAHILRPT